MKYIIRKRALGDVLWIEPVIAAFAQKNKKLIVHTKYNELFENYPHKNVLFKKSLSLLEKAFVRLDDIAKTKAIAINLDNAYETESKLHFLNAYQKKAGLSFTKEYPQIYLSEKEKQTRFVDGRYVVLHLESFSEKKFRQVYGVDWPAVVDYLNDTGFKVVQIGISTNVLTKAITVKTSLRQLISLLYNSSYFIGLDSGPSHIAASLGVPALIFFGAVDPKLRHFPELFKGILIKQSCEYDIEDGPFNYEEQDCKMADASGTPKCCIYTTPFVIGKIEQLINGHAEKAY